MKQQLLLTVWLLTNFFFCELNWFCFDVWLWPAKAKVATCLHATMPKKKKKNTEKHWQSCICMALAQMLSNWVNDTSTWLKNKKSKRKK